MQQIIEIPDLEIFSTLVGNHHKHLLFLEDNSNVEIYDQGNALLVQGTDENEIQLIVQVLQALIVLLERKIPIGLSDVVMALKMGRKGTLNQFTTLYEKTILTDYHGKPIRIKTLGQKKYIEAIEKNDITFGIGPAGTGKTFLAVVMAVKALKKGEVNRIIITRPAVEAGESLGFLPGDLKEKVDPYLRPIYDSLYSVLGEDQTNRLMERGVIEIAPLAYMRGRTLDDAFVILDEAQNTTTSQMKMFLTRLGYRSKMIVNGDKTQIDLPRGVRSGLIDAQQKLAQVQDIAFIRFQQGDVVRHPVVAKIIAAYEEKEIGDEK